MKSLFIFCLILLNVFTVNAQQLWPVRDETSGKFGYMDNNENIVIGYNYDFAGQYNEYGIAVVRLDNKYAYLNRKGIITTDWFDTCPEFLEQEEIVRKDGKYNIILPDGKLLYRDWYDFIYYYDDGRPNIVLYQGFWQFVKPNGKLDKFRYEDTYGWNDLKVMVKYNGEWLCWDGSSLELSDIKFTDVYEYSDGLSLQNKFGKYGYIDENGEIIIPFQFEEAYPFSDGYARVADNSGKYGFIDKKGKQIIDYEYFTATDFINGIARVGKFPDETAGLYSLKMINSYINKKGDLISGKWYTALGDFSEGLAWAAEMVPDQQTRNIKDLYGYIDRKGTEVIPARFDAARDFSDGLAAIAIKQGTDSLGDPVLKMGYIDTTGKIIIDCRFDYGNMARPDYPYTEAFQFSEGLASAGKITGLRFSSIPVPKYTDPKYNVREIGKPVFKFGYINEKGEMVIDYRFDYAGKFKNGTARVEIEEKEFYIDKKGNRIEQNKQYPDY